jgi:hypothetical protein
MPGATHCEEILEAMLSRLARAMKRDLTALEVDEVNVLFRTLRRPGMGEMDMKRPNVSKQLVDRIQVAVSDTVRAIRLGKLPYIKHSSSGGSVLGTFMWPEKHTWPGSLHAPIAKVQFAKFIEEGLVALMGPSVCSPQTTNILQGLLDDNGIPERSMDAVRAQKDFYATKLDTKRKRQNRKRAIPARCRDVGVQVTNGVCEFSAPGVLAPRQDAVVVSSATDATGISDTSTSETSTGSASDSGQERADGRGDTESEGVDEWEPEWDSENAHVAGDDVVGP